MPAYYLEKRPLSNWEKSRFLEICAKLPEPSRQLKKKTYLDIYKPLVDIDYEIDSKRLMRTFVRIVLEIDKHPVKWVLYMKEPAFIIIPRQQFMLDYLKYRESLK